MDKCPRCGKKLKTLTACDNELDEVYEIGEYCPDKECGYEKEY